MTRELMTGVAQYALIALSALLLVRAHYLAIWRAGSAMGESRSGGLNRAGRRSLVVSAMNGAANLVALFVAACALLAPGLAEANGHGPVFGLATPTNVQGGWTLDTTFMGRGGGDDNMAAFGTMLTYGIAPDLQVSVFAPALLTTTTLTPSQMTSMMPGNGAYEGLLAWRFQRDDFAPGSRYESTVYAGILFPGPQKLSGVQGDLAWAPGFYTALASGLASRSNYLWYGMGFTHYALADSDRRSDLLTYSLVYGYRPKFIRWDYPHWDGRFFLELTGEHFDSVTFDSAPLSGTAGDDLFFGPTTLWLYKDIGIEGGIQFPLFRSGGSRYGPETYRWAVDFSYFF